MARRSGTGFINAETYLNANRGAGASMAQGVVDETGRQGDAVRGALSKLQQGWQGQVEKNAAGGGLGADLAPLELQAQAEDVAARARLAGPGGGGGLASVLAQDYSKGPEVYTSGMAGWDSFLAGAAGGKALAASANKYGGLGGEVDAYNKAAAAYRPPVAAPAPAPAASPPPTPGYRGYRGMGERGERGALPAPMRARRPIESVYNPLQDPRRMKGGAR